MTRGVYQLGPAVVTYDCPGGGSSHYSWGGGFDCSAFIDRLQGGTGNGNYVNCSDCATFVSTFANILGCDLWQSRMRDNGFVSFGLNPMLGIGSSTWEPCCHGEPGWGDAFSYHEVAWTGACTVTERVYDGCLQVDGDADPTSGAAHRAVARGHRVRQPGRSVRIATGSPHRPAGPTAIRSRPRGSGAPSAERSTRCRHRNVKRLKERHRYNEWAGKSTMPSDRSVRKLHIHRAMSCPASPRARRPPRTRINHRRVTAFWRRGDTQAVVRVDVFECASVNAAHEYLIDALNEFESAGIVRRTDVNFGDVAFGTDSVACSPAPTWLSSCARQRPRPSRSRRSRRRSIH